MPLKNYRLSRLHIPAFWCTHTYTHHSGSSSKVTYTYLYLHMLADVGNVVVLAVPDVCTAADSTNSVSNLPFVLAKCSYGPDNAGTHGHQAKDRY